MRNQNFLGSAAWRVPSQLRCCASGARSASPAFPAIDARPVVLTLSDNNLATEAANVIASIGRGSGGTGPEPPDEMVSTYFRRKVGGQNVETVCG